MKLIQLEVADATHDHIEDLRESLGLSLTDLMKLALAVTNLLADGQTVTAEEFKEHLRGKEGA